jgi:hypothetical protein
MITGHRLLLGLALLVALAGCSADAATPTPPTSAPPISVPSSPAATKSSQPRPSPTIQDVMALEGDFSPLDRGTYFIDPDADPSTPLRVVYDVPVEGWSQWIGAVKFADDEDGHVGVSIGTVDNVVRQGCRNHAPAQPPVGPGVDDLATALTDLAPFQVSSPSQEVTVYGYRGKHLELTLPDMPVDEEGFTGCVDSNVASWMSPNLGPPGDDAFWGYSGPGYTEEFWILDVDGTRLMIAAERSAGSPAQALAEQQDILDSIRIEP